MTQFSNNSKGSANTKSATTAPSSKEKWVWQFKVSPSGILTLSIFASIILLFVFFCGMFIGRGQQTTVVRQELSTIIPEESTEKLLSTEDIMRPEDLNFMQNLKNDTVTTDTSTNANLVSQIPDPKAKAEIKVDAPKTETPKPTPQTNNAIFDYVFQVAAFKEESQADDLRATLEGVGLRTKLVKEKANKGTWYKVQVQLRGNQDAANEMLNTLTKIKITDALQVSKTAVK